MISSARLALPAAAIAIAVVAILANPPNAVALLFAGGKRDALFGLAMMALVPLTVAAQIGFGALVFGRVARGPNPAPLWLVWLSGSALFSLIGVVLAALGGINPWSCGVVLVVGVVSTVTYGAATPVIKRLATGTGTWARLGDVTADRLLMVVVRLGIVIAIVLIALRSATGELNDTDVVQFYWGWLNEVRHLGGTSLSADLPMVQQYAGGRGNGAYLLAAGVAPGLVSHVVSATYCVMFAVLLRAFVLRIGDDALLAIRPALVLAAEVACLSAVWMLPGAVAFGKYHLQFAAWALGLVLGCLHVATCDDGKARMHRAMLVPVAFAIPVGLVQFEAFVAPMIVIIAMLAPSRWRAMRRVSGVLLIGCVGFDLSLLANWLYIGIPDLNPFTLFERFILPARFDLWTSRLAQRDINYIGGGVLTLQDGGIGRLRALRGLAGELQANWVPLVLTAVALSVAIAAAGVTSRARGWRQPVRLLIAVGVGYGLYRVSGAIALSDLVLTPTLNRAALVLAATLVFALATGPLTTAASRPFVWGLLAYWLLCMAFVLVFHSGSMDRLMRHSDVIGVTLTLLAATGLIVRGRALLRATSMSALTRVAVPVMLGIGIAFSMQAAISTAAVDSPRHLFASTFGLQGRGVGLTNPMAKFGRCQELADSIPATSRALFLNAYTAMAYCNNAAILPRTMIVAPHESDYARELATSALADADTVERTLRRLGIDYFVFLKGDFEFWSSGLSAAFRPDEIGRRFDLIADTPSFDVLTWRGGGQPIPQSVVAAISELRRFSIQQSGFMARNEFVSQWRAMASLGADRPRIALGAPVSFTSSGWSSLYADHGWYAAEPHGTWTVGPTATLTLPLTKPFDRPLRVTMEVMPFIISQSPSQMVRVMQGGIEVARWNFQSPEAYQPKQFVVQPASQAGNDTIALTLEIENPVSQYALRLNKDSRPLGIAVRSLTVEDANPN